jgi:LytR cell envelope-related transcriptional attenuator
VAASSSPGSRPPLRTGGIALLGVGVVAAAIGLFTATSADDADAVAQAPPPSQVFLPTPELAPPTAPVVAAPPSDVSPPSASAPFVAGADGDGTAAGVAPPATAEPAPDPGNAVGGPAAGSGSGQAGSAGGGSDTGRSPLRVYNNSTVTGLAARAAGDLRGAGWTVTEIGGYPGADIPTSTVYYRPGTGEEAAAQEVGRAFGLRVEPRFAGIQQASPGVIVIVTKEYRSPGPS